MKVFWTLCWGIPAVMLTGVNITNRRGFQRHIVRIDLHECGSLIDIYFLEGKPLKNLKITALSTLEPAQMMEWLEESTYRLVARFYPIAIDSFSEYLLLPKLNTTVLDHKILSNVVNGVLIDCSD